MSFVYLWLVALLVLLILAGLAGRAAGRGWSGILIDERGRYSLNHLQIVLWTLLVLSTLVGLLLYSRPPLATALQIPQTLLVLMGISAGSAVTSGAIKSGKDVRGAAVQTKGILPAAAVNPGGGLTIPPRLAQVVLQEEGPLIDQVVDVTKFQNLIFTLVIAGVYVCLLVDRAKEGSPSFPNLDVVPNLLWLLGVSHAGYLAGKLPDKAKQGPDSAIKAARAARDPQTAAPSPPAVAPPPPPPPPSADARPPTWQNYIQGLFNAVDVGHMVRDPGGSGKPLDLGSYQSVKANGQRIYDEVSSHRMPKPPSQPWTQEMIATFKAWMDAGSPES